MVLSIMYTIIVSTLENFMEVTLFNVFTWVPYCHVLAASRQCRSVDIL